MGYIPVAISMVREVAPPHRRTGAVVADRRLMWLLTEGEPLTMREVGERLGLEASTVNRQVNAAIKAGLVERVARPGSAARPVRPTGLGSRVYARDLGLVVSALEAAMGAVPADEVDAFVRNLAAFVAAYDEVASTGHATD